MCHCYYSSLIGRQGLPPGSLRYLRHPRCVYHDDGQGWMIMCHCYYSSLMAVKGSLLARLDTCATPGVYIMMMVRGGGLCLIVITHHNVAIEGSPWPAWIAVAPQVWITLMMFRGGGLCLIVSTPPPLSLSLSLSLSAVEALLTLLPPDPPGYLCHPICAHHDHAEEDDHDSVLFLTVAV
jgi:hypothetical protein